MLTRDLGATGPADCLAPPGWAQPSPSADIAECPRNYYKEGWNRNVCVACGTNVVTSDVGSSSKDDCLVPAGFGLVQLTPTLIASRYGPACLLQSWQLGTLPLLCVHS
jgi:hypothetical protein